MKILLLVTVLMSHNGNVIPDTEVVEVDNMYVCSTMAAEVVRLAREDGRKVFTYCTPPRKLEDLK